MSNFKEALKSEINFDEPYNETRILSSTIGKKIYETLFEIHIEDFKDTLNASKEGLEVIASMLPNLKTENKSDYFKEQMLIQEILSPLANKMETLRSPRYKQVVSRNFNNASLPEQLLKEKTSRYSKKTLKILLQALTPSFHVRIKALHSVVKMGDFELYFRSEDNTNTNKNFVQLISFKTTKGMIYFSPLEEIFCLVSDENVLVYRTSETNSNKNPKRVLYLNLNDMETEDGAKNQDVFLYNRSNRVQFKEVTQFDIFKSRTKISNDIKTVKIYNDKELIAVGFDFFKEHDISRDFQVVMIKKDYVDKLNILVGEITKTVDIYSYFEDKHSVLKNEIFGERIPRQNNKEQLNPIFYLPDNFNDSNFKDYKDIFELNVKI